MQVLEIQPKDLDESKQTIVEAKIDTAFRKINKNAVCFQMWKVEQDRVELIPKASYGTFYDDCTYIIYGASTSGTYSTQDTITREIKSPASIERFIHFWLGTNTTTTKSGNVAYKVMELDTHFGHLTTQYRESQGNESARFLSYFKKGIIVLSHEVAQSSGDCRLYRVSGRKWTSCIEMNSVSWEHFASAYIMILQTPKYVFLWVGRSTSSTERRNAWEMAANIREKNNIPDITIVDDGYEQAMSEARKHDWNIYLSLKNRFVHQLSPTGHHGVVPLKLYKCGYFSGKYRIEELKTDEPEQSDLSDLEAAYIIDGSVNGVWVWVGRRATIQEKVEAMRNARGFVKKKKYSSTTPVAKVLEGHEPVEFTRLFPIWKYVDNSSTKMSNILGKLDSLTLVQRPKMAAETQLIDDGSGEKHIFRLTDGEYVECPSKKNLAFFSGDCYILHYSVNVTTEPHSIQNVVYIWYGHETTNETRKKCDTMADAYFAKLEINSMMIKLVDGLETPHFLQIFGGKFIAFSGQGADYNHNPLSPSEFVLKVSGDSSYNSKAVQQDSLLMLSPKDCFVIKSDNVWVWCGQSSTGDAREVAKTIGAIFGEYTLVMESKEPEEFWNTVINKFVERKNNGLAVGSVSPIERQITNIDKSRVALYIAYVDQGSIITKEILAFEQEDLLPEDVYLLDAGNMVFIWIGAFCTSSINDVRCWSIARDFLQNYPVHRDENTAIALIQQGSEPNIFTGFFDKWDVNCWKKHVSFDMIRQSVDSYISPTLNLQTVANGDSDFDKHQKYPLAVLQQEADTLPAGVNPTKKEVHLTHDDFVSLFNMRYSEFNSLPPWKKQELKKKYKLF